MIYRRADSPYWWIFLEPTGRQYSTKIPADDPNPARAKGFKERALERYYQDRAKATHEALEPPPAPTITLDAYLTWYEQHVGAEHRGIERERYAYKRLREGLGHLELKDITKQLVAEWRTRRLTTAAPTTVNREVDTLKLVLASAVPTYLTQSPLVRWKGLRVVPKQKRTLSRADEAKLLDALQPADRALVILAIDTLVRLHDVLDLRVEHRDGNTLVIVDPKVAPYTAALSPRAAKALDGLTPDKDGYYFHHRRGAATERDRRGGIAKMLRIACKEAKIKYGRKGGLTFHGLRHTGATRLMQGGVSQRIIMAQGGWRDPRSVARYQHPDLVDQAKAAALISGVPFTKYLRTRKTARKTQKKR